MSTKNQTSLTLIGLLSGLAIALIALILVDLQAQKTEPPLSTRESVELRTGSPPIPDPQIPGPKTAQKKDTTDAPAGTEAGTLHSTHPIPTVSMAHRQAVSQETPQASNQKLYDRLSILTRQNRDEEAMDVLQKIIKNDPDDLKAYALLGELYYQNDRLAQAITVWEKILDIDPFNEGIKGLLAKAQREHKAHGAFTHEVTRHFRIKFEGSENRDLYKTVLDILEEAYSEVGKTLSFYPRQEIIVFLYTQKQFFDVTRAPAWSGGIFDGKIRIPAGGYENHLDRLRQVLFHEYAHAVVHQITVQGIIRTGENSVSGVPTWFHEGVAQYLEPDSASQADVDQRLKKWVDQEVFIELSRLQGSFLGFNTLMAGLAYDESLSAVMFMVDTFGPYSLQKFLNALAQQKTVDEAMRDAIFISYEEFQARWEDHLRSS